MKFNEFKLVFIVLLIPYTIQLQAQNIKWNKIRNTQELYSCHNLVSNYLLKNYDDSIFYNTGISVYSLNNNLVIMHGTFNNQQIELKKLLVEVYEVLKNEKIDFGKIRYFIIGSHVDQLNKGCAIAVSGENFKSNIDNFDKILPTQISFCSNVNSKEDPDLNKVLKAVVIESNYRRIWLGKGSSKTNYWDEREQHYSKSLEECYKKIEKL